MADAREIELVFEPQEGGGYHVYAPELPGLHTQGDDMDDAMANANEAVALYVEGLREDGESLDMGVVRRKIPSQHESPPAGGLRSAPHSGVGGGWLESRAAARQSRPT